jgi:hypothetical protein
MRLKIKRVLTIITFELWTVAWDISPTPQLRLRKVSHSLAFERIRMLQEHHPAEEEEANPVRPGLQP